jgi:hypothetical protein
MLGFDIYDPPICVNDEYQILKLPGRLSLLFPRGLRINEPSSLTIQWEARNFRYQADRKFIALTGMVKTLVLTEIQPENVGIYGNLY